MQFCFLVDQKLLLQTNMHYSERGQEQDDDIQIISDVKKKATSTSITIPPKTTIKKRKKKREPEKSDPSVRKISDFFKKQ